MTDQAEVTLDREGHVTILTIDRPDRRNAVDRATSSRPPVCPRRGVTAYRMLLDDARLSPGDTVLV